jgi:tetratricopeptide (TPR) repeat protein
MPTEPGRWRQAALIALAMLAATVVWWAAARLPREKRLLALGRSAYDHESWEAAADNAREALKIDPSSSDAVRLLARSLGRLGRDESALALFGRLGGDNLEAEDDFLLARVLARRNQPAAARAQLWKAHEKDPLHGESLHDLIRVLASDDEPTKAVDLALALQAVPGWQGRGAVALGVLRAAQDNPALAAEAVEAALSLEPSPETARISAPTVRKQLARHRLALGQPARARAALGAVDDAEARWLLSRADLQEGKPCQAQGTTPRDPLAREPAPFVGTARCAHCHGAIARAQGQSHHARTFWARASLAVLPLPAGPLADPGDPRVVHALNRDGTTIRVETRVDGQTYRAVLAYAFGSGEHGLTPVGRDDAGHWCELRLSRYADGPLWDVTTGHSMTPAVSSEWLGKTLSEDELRRCVECHTTAARAAREDAGALANDRGIGCERCHGPGGNHLKAVAAGLADLAIARPKLAHGEPIVRLCGQCHSPKGRTVSASDPSSIRFQATTLTWSRCYTQSKDQLDCVTCHDPHRNAETARVFYEAKCLGCHGATSTTRCPVNSSSDCITCHMPARRGAAPHAMFTDHHIRIHSISPRIASPAGTSE